MKKRTLLICLAVLVCLSGIGVRIWYVNKDRQDWVEEIYPMGEMVPYEDDFFIRSDEGIRPDYEIGAMSAKIMSTEDYLKEYGLSKEEVWEGTDPPKIIIDVEVNIRNNSKEENDQFIDLLNTRLVAGGDNFQSDKALIENIYPQLAGAVSGFKVKSGTEATMHIPFEVLQWQPTSIERIKSQDLYMVLSLYPTKKMIKIELE